MLNREYSMMARLGVIPPRTMSGRDFIYHTDMIQKDIADEETKRTNERALKKANVHK